VAFNVNGTNALVKAEVSVGVSAAGASAITTQDVVVSGVLGTMCINAYFASAHSAGFYIQEVRVLSTNNLRMAFFNATGSSITHGATLFRFVSA
jgi:hypothetical protein